MGVLNTVLKHKDLYDDGARRRPFGDEVTEVVAPATGARLNLLAPFGGHKQSGSGREPGVHGPEEFLRPKALQLPAPTGRTAS